MHKEISVRTSHAEFLAGLTFEDLEEITMNFSRKFAQSPYGRIYWLFAQELGKLSMFDHPNLARLLGYCCQEPGALCFEYFLKGSLHQHLSDASNGMEWRTRYRIIKGTCEASKYIHVELGEPNLHVLLEPRNIFLDKNMEPKLVALGLLQRLCGLYDSKYLAPEYEDTRVDIEKGYIFSLGIVMMEIIAGPMSYIRISDLAQPQFIDQVQEKWRKRMQQTGSDSELEFCCQQIKRCIEIALSCVDNDDRNRPNIMEIINKLNETECYIGQTQVGWPNHQTVKMSELSRLQFLYVMKKQGLLKDEEWEEEPILKQLYDGNYGGQEMNNLNVKLNSSIDEIVQLCHGNHGGQEMNNVNVRLNSKSSADEIFPLCDGNLVGQEMDNVNVRVNSKSNAELFQWQYSSAIPQRDISDLPQLQTGPSSDIRKASKLDRAAKEQHAESNARVPSPQSLAPYIRMPNGRNEHGSRKQNSSLVRMDGMYISQLKALERIIDRSEPPSNLSLAVLQIITKNFSDELIIGRGGCGVVYKGILTNGIIAVKKLFNSHTFDDKMFHQEVQSMMMVNHQNTVHFLGYCSHTEEKAMDLEGTVIMVQIRERLLCFEYIGNGSLESHLTDELRGLEWHTRYQIIQRICEGLQHLHKEKHIIHMDLKPANILLDDQMVPKITDFGLSRLDGKSQTTSAQRLLSLGYCAPEYLHHGKRSAKSDIYSLGVIILELVTGSKQIPCTTKVLRKWKHRWNKSTKDIQLGYKQVAKCLNLARRCTRMDPVDRPSIWDIISDLNNMDNSDVDISDATECLELEDMLGVEPLEIHLPFELNKQISCSVELTNDTDDYLAFRISTTSLRPYCINTNKDILPPRSKRSVTITLQALQKEPQHNQHRDEFSVQSTRVDGNLTPKDITGELFAEHSGKVVDDVNLVLVLDVPPPLPGDR